MALLLSFDDFELDEARFELRRGDDVVTIQPKVLELILFLAQHRDRVVSKDELFETLWDGTAVTEASLTQAVSLARKALGDSSKQQRVLRTVRGRGLQFVADTSTRRISTPPTRPSGPLANPARPITLAGATEMETHQDLAPSRSDERVAVLVAIVHGEAPHLGGASWSLADLDEVHLGRGSRRRTRRESDLTRLLTLTIPGRRLSRQHARLTRTPNGWMVVDEGSRNGTLVDGQRIERHHLEGGDRIECGSTLFLFTDTDATPLAHIECNPQALLPTVIPSLSALDAELGRVADSDVPLLLSGESGTGKTHLAEAIHRASGRQSWRSVDVAALTVEGADRLAELGAETTGTLVVEGVDRLQASLAPRLARALEDTTARVIATSQQGYAELEARLPRDVLSRISGYRVHLPPLRERVGDLGTLIAAMLEAPPALTADAIAALASHPWPGNLRELALVLRAAALVAGDEPITLEHLPAEVRAVSE